MRISRRLAVVVVAAASVILVSGCSDDHGTAIQPGSTPATPTAVQSLSPAVDHVHGAVLVDGRLLLGTHTGLVEVDMASGTTTTRGAGRDDLMGLAADGAVLFASGHPGEGSDLPDPVGLVRSDDGGQTWQPVSLTGEVDFHGLAADGARVAGIGTEDGVLLSEDGGQSWRGIDISGATSLAWFQGDLWVTTADRPRVWSDGRVAPAPSSAQAPLVLSASDDGTALWSVLPDGTVWRTLDGAAWAQHGAITALEALAVTPDEAIAVTADSMVRITAD